MQSDRVSFITVYSEVKENSAVKSFVKSSAAVSRTPLSLLQALTDPKPELTCRVQAICFQPFDCIFRRDLLDILEMRAGVDTEHIYGDFSYNIIQIMNLSITYYSQWFLRL